jgi:2-haloacid dehalogenase
VSATLDEPIDSRPHVLSFDCYGTLIDWERGILDALGPLLQRHGVQRDEGEILELFARLESAAEAGTYLPYRDVLRRVVAGFGDHLGFEPGADDLDALARSLPDWPPFPDTGDALRSLSEGFKLAIISNVDDDLFAGTARHLPVRFDWVITAQQVESYKPALRNFEAALERIAVPRRRLLHVAQSLYHDIEPARRRGIRTVWVNRRSGKAGTGATPPGRSLPDREVPDLATLARLLAT